MVHFAVIRFDGASGACQGVGLPRMCVQSLRAILLFFFEFFAETKLYGHKMSQAKAPPTCQRNER